MPFKFEQTISKNVYKACHSYISDNRMWAPRVTTDPPFYFYNSKIIANRRRANCNTK